jgi:demethylspheroidene O-methyltransferase
MPASLATPAPTTPRLGSVVDTVLAWRDRLVASPRFRRFAAAFPLTRPIARRKTRELFDLCAGFVYSQILLACVRLKLFDLLAERPQTADQIAARIGLPLERTERLLAAAVSLKLVARRGGNRFGLGPLGAAMVGNAAISEMVLHHTMFYADLRDPVALLRDAVPRTELSTYWAYGAGAAAEGAESQATHAYTALMAASQPLVADEVLDAYPLKNHRCLMDMGGGNGTFIRAAARREKSLRLVLFDLPPVAALAEKNFAAAGLGDRASAVGGDFFAPEKKMPQWVDIVSLVRVVHDHDDDAALAILRAARAALPKGGTLLLAEPMAGTKGAEPIGDAYFGFYLLAMGRGRARTPAELFSMLSRAGFSNSRQLATHTPLLVSVIVSTAE